MWDSLLSCVLPALRCLALVLCCLQEHRSTKIAVISGVGTRHYYRKLGYQLEGPYMVKYLVQQQQQPADAGSSAGAGAQSAGGCGGQDGRVQRRRWTRPVAAVPVPGYNAGAAALPAQQAVAAC